eukprot:scaffold162869_cov14-Prasinocladus_malaysianus.AAC.1
MDAWMDEYRTDGQTRKPAGRQAMTERSGAINEQQKMHTQTSISQSRGQKTVTSYWCFHFRLVSGTFLQSTGKLNEMPRKEEGPLHLTLEEKLLVLEGIPQL